MIPVVHRYASKYNWDHPAAKLVGVHYNPIPLCYYCNDNHCISCKFIRFRQIVRNFLTDDILLHMSEIFLNVHNNWVVKKEALTLLTNKTIHWNLSLLSNTFEGVIFKYLLWTVHNDGVIPIPTVEDMKYYTLVFQEELSDTKHIRDGARTCDQKPHGF